MMPTSPSDQENLQMAVRLAAIRPKKGLGQNFLVDSACLDMIATAAVIKPTETVLEIGPGLGFLTSRLASQAKRVVAVETDPELAAILGQDAPANLEVVTANIMSFDLSSLPEGYKVVANIPYYLTSALLRLLLESPNPPSLMSLLVQKEVAQRIVAEPGRLSVLGLSVQYYAYAKIIGGVQRHKSTRRLSA
jgi:16S rRNA (adenine1518-N6/adenine1519-N6)-dimethyltransferase